MLLEDVRHFLEQYSVFSLDLGVPLWQVRCVQLTFHLVLAVHFVLQVRRLLWRVLVDCSLHVPQVLQVHLLLLVVPTLRQYFTR